jgi:hypothetical protein
MMKQLMRDNFVPYQRFETLNPICNKNYITVVPRLYKRPKVMVAVVKPKRKIPHK